MLFKELLYTARSALMQIPRGIPSAEIDQQSGNGTGLRFQKYARFPSPSQFTPTPPSSCPCNDCVTTSLNTSLIEASVVAEHKRERPNVYIIDRGGYWSRPERAGSAKERGCNKIWKAAWGDKYGPQFHLKFQLHSVGWALVGKDSMATSGSGVQGILVFALLYFSQEGLWEDGWSQRLVLTGGSQYCCPQFSNKLQLTLKTVTDDLLPSASMSQQHNCQVIATIGHHKVEKVQAGSEFQAGVRPEFTRTAERPALSEALKTARSTPIQGFLSFPHHSVHSDHPSYELGICLLTFFYFFLYGFMPVLIILNPPFFVFAHQLFMILCLFSQFYFKWLKGSGNIFYFLVFYLALVLSNGSLSSEIWCQSLAHAQKWSRTDCRWDANP